MIVEIGGSVSQDVMRDVQFDTREVADAENKCRVADNKWE